MKPDKASSPSQETSTPLGGSDHVLDYMKALGLPLTRENYLALNFPEGAPDPLPQELEQLMPRDLPKET